MDFSPSEVEGTIPARLRRVAETWPDRPAARLGAAEITFAQLLARSDRIARDILLRRGPVSEPVAVLVQPGPDALCAVFGLLQAGKTVLQLSPSDDRRRLDTLWENALRPPILADDGNFSLAVSLAQSEGACLRIGGAASGAAPPTPETITPDTPAALLYTSGTTSLPKGVVMTHRMLLDTAHYYRSHHQYTAGDRFSFLSAAPSSAVIAVSIYTLLCGVTFVHPPPINDRSVTFLDWIGRERISLLSVTALALFLQYVRAYGRRAQLPDLRKVNLSGADFFRKDLEALRGVLPPEAEIVYRLASTDMNQICEHRLPPSADVPWEKIPVGRAVVGREVFLLDGERRPVPEGEIGVIAVRSRFLPQGYWRQPELTADRFLPDPGGGDRRILVTEDMGRFLPGGLLEHLGRTDNIARLRGQNVQLEEVERQILRVPGIREAAARILPQPGGRKKLAAYIVPRDGCAFTADALRRDLDPFLPPHMIPSAFVFLDSLPKLSTGKVNRNTLPPPSGERPLLSTPYQAPLDETEEKLAGLWGDLLQIRPVGRNDNFFDLGGDSLLALTMSLSVEEAFHRSIPPAYFRTMTIAALADIWRREDGVQLPSSGPEEEDRPRRTSAPRTPVYLTRATPGGAISRRTNPGVALASLAAMRMPYERGCRWVAFLCRLPPFRRLFLEPRIRLFRDFRAALGGCPDAPQDAEWISLAGNILWSSHARAGLNELAEREALEGMRKSSAAFWRDLAAILDGAPSGRFEKTFHVCDWKYLAEAYAAGKGVILAAFHTTSRMAAAAISRRLQSEPIQTISGIRARRVENIRRKERELDSAVPDETTLITDLMMRGYQTLAQGEIIQIVPDGTDFSVQDEPLAVGGRVLYIQSGFAKLALSTDAAVIPVATTRRLDGSIHSRFFPPLVPRDGNAPLEEKIFDLVRQYAGFLDSSWRRSPETVRWSKMEKHLRRPASPRPPSAVRG